MAIHRHGMEMTRGMNFPDAAANAEGRFGRMFPHLPAFFPEDEKLIHLGREGGSMAEEAQNPRGVNERIPAGFVFFGQFIDHDITLDTTSELDKQADATASRNFRNPTLGLDNIYGSGPEATPFLYDNEAEGKFLIDTEGWWFHADDLPRNAQGTALIGDPRNDENHILAQLQLAMLKFHNAVYDKVKNGDIKCERIYEDDFEEAQRIVRWHYQWVILHEFLPLTVGEHLVDDILQNGRQVYAYEYGPFIPVEFSVAAYRFGHSQVPAIFDVNNNNRNVTLFGLNEVRRTNSETRAEARVDWRRFFEFSSGEPQFTRRIDEKLAHELLALPFIEPRQGNEHLRSLATRNLLRGKTFSLPAGEDLARAIGASKTFTAADFGLNGKDGRPKLEKTPAWFYILKEADLQQEGTMLGEVGGRITAEVLVGLMEGEPRSYLNMAPNWQPCLPSEEKGKFGMTDLLRTAGVVEELEKA